MSKISETHDELVNAVVPAILSGPIEAGGSVADVMTVLASVVVAVVSVCANDDRTDDAYRIFLEEVERRLREQRLRVMDVKGSA